MANLIFQHPSDQLLSGSITITPSSEDPDYPKAHLYDGNPARAFKLDATSGNIVFDFGTATNIDLVAIVHHNLDAASDVKIQGNATDSWGAPTLSQSITIPAYQNDGFPVNPFLDLSALSNSFRYWRLLFNSTNSVEIQLGQVWLGGTKRALTHNISWGFKEVKDRRLIKHTTDYDVQTIYDLGASIISIDGEIRTSDAGMTLLEAWWDACRGAALPHLMIPDPAVNRCWLVRWAEEMRSVGRDFKNDNILRANFREVSRGLVF